MVWSSVLVAVASAVVVRSMSSHTPSSEMKACSFVWSWSARGMLVVWSSVIVVVVVVAVWSAGNVFFLAFFFG